MKKLARISIVIALLYVCFVLWGTLALDYGDRVASGKYSLSQNDETSALVLKPDHTFQQDLRRSGKFLHAEGRWRRFGEGGIEFSKEFLVVSGQELSADGVAYADLHKTLGVFPSIILADYHVLWYGRLDPSPDKTALGNYAGDEEGVAATLVLKSDHTFEQTISRAALAKNARGSWSLNQRGDIVFSREFLKTSGECLREDETATALNPEGSNLQILIAATSKTGGPPTYRKRYFTW